jgi:hypothetical protein
VPESDIISLTTLPCRPKIEPTYREGEGEEDAEGDEEMRRQREMRTEGDREIRRERGRELVSGIIPLLCSHYFISRLFLFYFILFYFHLNAVTFKR